MALTPSNMLPIGTKAPDFNLIDTKDDQTKTLNHLKGKVGTLVMFICNHCPFVIHIKDQLVKLSNDYKDKGVSCIAISSNDVEYYPQDGPKAMKQYALKNNYSFPYLYDETQAIAKAYDAACTPDFFLFNESLNLVYTGQLDSSRPGNGVTVTGEDIRLAMDNLTNGSPINTIQKPSMGCNIKWK